MLSDTIRKANIFLTIGLTAGACSAGNDEKVVTDSGDTGSDTGGNTPVDTGNSCDSDEGSGGEYSVTMALDTANPYAAAASAQMEANAIRLTIYGWSDEESDTDSTRINCTIANKYVSLGDTLDVFIPSGSVLADAFGAAYSGGNHGYVYACGGSDGPTYVADDAHVTATLALPCSRDVYDTAGDPE